jgi:tetratricopeptide (TPR) repeat protein
VLVGPTALLSLLLLAAPEGPPPLAPDKASEISAQLAKEPGNASLYVKRAQVLRDRGDRASALADLELAASLPGGVVDANLLAGEVLLELDRPAEAVPRFEAVLGADPRHVPALIGKARAQAAIGRRADAAATFGRAFALVPDPNPDHYVEYARLLGAVGPKRLPEAIAVLDRGIARLGPIVSLQIPALEFEEQARRWDAAAARVDALVASAGRKDVWLKRKGDLLARAGRRAQAKAAWKEARAAIDTLPAGLRQSPPVLALAEELDALLGGAAVSPRPRTARSGSRPAR